MDKNTIAFVCLEASALLLGIMCAKFIKHKDYLGVTFSIVVLAAVITIKCVLK